MVNISPLLLSFEGTLDQADAGGTVGAVEQGEDVETDVGMAGRAATLQVPGGQLQQFLPFLEIDRLFRKPEPGRGAGFDLHEAKSRAVPRHHVNFAEAGPQVPVQDAVAVVPKIADRLPFPFPAEQELIDHAGSDES